MRILMVSNLWPPEVVGGAEQYASALAAHLRAAGHEVDVLTLGVDGPDVVARGRRRGRTRSRRRRRNPRAGGCCSTRSTCYNPRAGRTLDAVLDELPPDVVHTHAVQGLSSVALTRPGRHGVAHVHTLHDYWLLCQRNSMVHRDGRALRARGAGRASAISWIRNEAVRRSPPGVVLAVSRAIAAEHEQLAWIAAADAGALQPGRGRRRVAARASRARAAR